MVTKIGQAPTEIKWKDANDFFSQTLGVFYADIVILNKDQIWQQTNSEGKTPLQDKTFLQLVLDHGASEYINSCVNPAKDTPLILAIRIGDLGVVKRLLECGALIEQSNKEEHTPLFEAVSNEHLEMTQLLLDHGASPMIETYYGKKLSLYPLHEAVLKINVEITRLLLERGASMRPNIAYHIGMHPDDRMLALFLQYNVSGNKPDGLGITLIQRLAQKGPSVYLDAFLGKEVSKFNPNAYFTSKTDADCRLPTQIFKLYPIPFELFSDPITAAQNFCNTVVKMRDGTELILENTAVRDVYRHLYARRQQIYGTTQQPGDNLLTFILNPGHAAVALKCTSCSDGNPFNECFGFSPAGRKSFQTKDLENKPLFESFLWSINPIGSLDDNSISERVSSTFNFLKLSFPINDTQANAVFNHKKKVDEACRVKGKLCRYGVKNNCVSFAQNVFDAAGMEGHFAKFFTDGQLQIGFRNPQHYQAINFAYVSSSDNPWGLAVGAGVGVGAAVALGVVVCKITKNTFTSRPVQYLLNRARNVLPAQLRALSSKTTIVMIAVAAAAVPVAGYYFS